MKFRSGQQARRDFWFGGALSILLHALLALLIVIIWFADPAVDEEAAAQDKPEYTEVFLDDAFDEQIRDRLDQDDRSPRQDEDAQDIGDQEEHQQDEEDEEDEEDVQQEPEPEHQEPWELPPELYAVEQLTDGEEPDEADHIADEAHRSDEETIAEVTTVEDVEEPIDPEALEQQADTDLEMAIEMPEQIEPPDRIEYEWFDEPEVEPEVLEEEQQREERRLQEHQATRHYRDPRELFVVDEHGEHLLQNEEEQQGQKAMFGDAGRDYVELDMVDGGEHFVEPGAPTEGGGRQLLANWRENENAMRASLENFLPHIQPGNHTSVNARQADHASYIAGMHRTIHVHWAMDFLSRLASNYPNRHRLNDMSLSTVVEIVIDADSGEVLETGRVQPSGHTLFDAEALNMTRNLPPQPDPPESIISPDGRVYIHWTFWRDQRQCGTFGVRIFRRHAPGDGIGRDVGR